MVTPPFSKGSVLKMFSVHKNSSGLKSVFEKLRFRDGLVWTVGLTVDIKLRFQVPPASCGHLSANKIKCIAHRKLKNTSRLGLFRFETNDRGKLCVNTNVSFL